MLICNQNIYQKTQLLAAFRDFCQNMADILNKAHLWIRVWFDLKNFNIFRLTTKFCFRKSVNKKIYSNYDLTMGITKRSFNTKNVKEKLFPFHEKSGFASKSINR